METNRKKSIRLNLGGCSWLPNRPPNITIHNMSNRELENGYPTLRDVAIILYQCVGQGAQWNIAREMAKRTGYDIHILNEALEDIIEEYADITEEEGYERWRTGIARHIASKKEDNYRRRIKKIAKRKNDSAT
jgi:hypothetical protein